MTLSVQHKSFFLWALRFRPKSLADFLKFLPQNVQNELNELSEKIQNLDDDQLQTFALKELKKMGRSFQTSYLPEVHTDWLLERLKDESPYMISAILRYLPADRVNKILQGLPEDVLAGMPSLKESFAISDGLASALKKRFENQFRMERVYDPHQKFDFPMISFLKPHNLAELFQVLGYREVALGLRLLPDRTRDLVFGRLLPKDRTEVERCLLDMKQVSESRHKKAQVHIISKEIDPYKPALFIKEIGLLVFSKAVLQDNLKDVEVISHKLPMAEGEMLKTYVDQHLMQNSEATVLGYRDEILHVVRRLLKGSA